VVDPPLRGTGDFLKRLPEDRPEFLRRAMAWARTFGPQAGVRNLPKVARWAGERLRRAPGAARQSLAGGTEMVASIPAGAMEIGAEAFDKVGAPRSSAHLKGISDAYKGVSRRAVDAIAGGAPENVDEMAARMMGTVAPYVLAGSTQPTLLRGLGVDMAIDLPSAASSRDFSLAGLAADSPEMFPSVQDSDAWYAPTARRLAASPTVEKIASSPTLRGIAEAGLGLGLGATIAGGLNVVGRGIRRLKGALEGMDELANIPKDVDGAVTHDADFTLESNLPPDYDDLPLLRAQAGRAAGRMAVGGAAGAASGALEETPWNVGEGVVLGMTAGLAGPEAMRRGGRAFDAVTPPALRGMGAEGAAVNPWSSLERPDAERFAWKANAEGGQARGNEQMIVPVDEEIYEQHVRRLGRSDLSFDDYRAEHGDTHASFVRTGDAEPRLTKVGTRADLEPTPRDPSWVRKVDAFDAADATQQTSVADSRVPGEVETGMKGKWFSRLQRAIESAPQETATAEQWQGIIRKAKGGISGTELEWTGVPRFLEDRAGQKITRTELLEHARSNAIEVGEVRRGYQEAGSAQEASKVSQDAHNEVRRIHNDISDRLTEDYDVSFTDAENFLLRLRNAEGDDAVNEVLNSMTDTLGRKHAMGSDFSRAVAAFEDEALSYRDASDAYAQANAGRKEAAGGRPEFGKWTQGEHGLRPESNYKETAITLDRDKGDAPKRWHLMSNGEPLGQAYETRAAAADALRALPSDRQPFVDIGERQIPHTGSGTFRSQSHWRDVDNPLVHNRSTDRVTSTGERAYHFEEGQSDWHQKGRKEGYRPQDTAAAREAKEAKGRELTAALDEWRKTGGNVSTQGPDIGRLRSELGELTDALDGEVPDAPYKKTDEWMGLAFRRALQDAVEGDYERFTWSTGEQVADLYDLRNQVSRLEWHPLNEGGQLRGFDLDGNMVVDESLESADKLPDFIGKGPAERLLDATPSGDRKLELIQAQSRAVEDFSVEIERSIREGTPGPQGLFDETDIGLPEALRNDPGAFADGGLEGYGFGPAQFDELDQLGRSSGFATRVIKGEDLAVGGSGMVELYNKFLPKVIQKEIKKLGAKVEPVSLTPPRGFTYADMPKVGTKVTLARNVDRYPHARVEIGETGTVTHSDEGFIGVTLDKIHDGLDEWDNELAWYTSGTGVQSYGDVVADLGLKIDKGDAPKLPDGYEFGSDESGMHIAGPRTRDGEWMWYGDDFRGQPGMDGLDDFELAIEAAFDGSNEFYEAYNAMPIDKTPKVDPSEPTNLSFKITDEMREKVRSEGLMLASRGGGTIAGGAYGYATGEDDQDRVDRMMKFGGLGFAIDAGLASRAGRSLDALASGPGFKAKSTRIHELLDGSEKLKLPKMPTIRDLGTALAARAKKIHGRVLDLTDDLEVIAETIAEEARLAMDDASNAQEWYRASLERAFQRVAEARPRIAEDPLHLDAFRFGLAVTSNGQQVQLNSRYALEVYDAFAETGRFPIKGWGKEKKAMEHAFGLFNSLADRIGEDKLLRMMDTEFTVGELKKAGLNVSGELVDTPVPGSVIFGPKIGGGFYRNLGGFFDEVTMDRWFRRTVGRVTGDMLEAPAPGTLPKSERRLRTAMRRRGTRAGDDLLTEARGLVKEWEARFRKSRPKRKPEWAKAAEAYLRHADPTVRDAPRSGSERQQMRAVVRRVQDMLEERTGTRHDAASIQAMVWYPEKRLYESFGIRGGANDIDYDIAFQNILGEGDETVRGAAAGVDRAGDRGARRLAGPESTAAREGFHPEGKERVLEHVRTGEEPPRPLKLRGTRPRGERAGLNLGAKWSDETGRPLSEWNELTEAQQTEQAQQMGRTARDTRLGGPGTTFSTPDMSNPAAGAATRQIAEMMATGAIGAGLGYGDERDVGRATLWGIAGALGPQAFKGKGPLLKRLTTARKAGMLSALSTTGMNVSSTASSVGLGTVSAPQAAVWDRIIATYSGFRAKGGITWRTLAGMKDGVPKAARDAWDVLRKGDTPAELEKYDLQRVEFDNPVMQAVTDGVFRFLSAQDRAFWSIVQSRTIAELADVAARNLLDEGRTGAGEIDEIRSFLTNNPTDDMAVASAIAASTEVFRYRGNLASMVNKLRKEISSWGPEAEAMFDLLFPFTSTPANVVGMVTEYSPLGVFGVVQDARALREFVEQGHSDLKNLKHLEEGVRREGSNVGVDADTKFTARQEAQYTQRRISERLGRATTGSAVMALGAWMAHKKWLTPDYPDDERERRRFRAANTESGALQIKGKQYPIQRLAPLVPLLIMGAEMYAAAERDDDELAVIGSGVDYLTKTVSNESFLGDIDMALNLFSGPQPLSERWGDLGADVAGSMVPNVARRALRGYDPTIRERRKPSLREPDTLLDPIRERVPGLRGKMPERIDILGDPVSTGEGGIKAALAYSVNPFSGREPRGNDDPVWAEIVRVGAAISDYRPPGLQRGTHEYEEALREYGAEVREKLEREIRRGSYKRADMEEQARRLASVAGAARRSVTDDRKRRARRLQGAGR